MELEKLFFDYKIIDVIKALSLKKKMVLFSSLCKYNPSNKYYRLKNEINVGFDVTKKINWNI